MLDKNGIARRIAQELRDGWYVNLGIGIPTLVANHIPQGISVEFQSENGILGMGPFPTEAGIEAKAPQIEPHTRQRDVNDTADPKRLETARAVYDQLVERALHLD